MAEKNVVVLDETTYVGVAAKIMRDKDVSSVLVSRQDSDNFVGIVTERDILFRVIAESRGPFKATLGDVMTSPLVTVDEATSVKDAIALMRKKVLEDCRSQSLEKSSEW